MSPFLVGCGVTSGYLVSVRERGGASSPAPVSTVESVRYDTNTGTRENIGEMNPSLGAVLVWEQKRKQTLNQARSTNDDPM